MQHAVTQTLAPSRLECRAKRFGTSGTSACRRFFGEATLASGWWRGEFVAAPRA
ncbi:MAG: hypothetical protein WAN30_00275 [Acidimicrobiales bacterium]